MQTLYDIQAGLMFTHVKLIHASLKPGCAEDGWINTQRLKSATVNDFMWITLLPWDFDLTADNIYLFQRSNLSNRICFLVAKRQTWSMCNLDHQLKDSNWSLLGWLTSDGLRYRCLQLMSGFGSAASFHVHMIVPDHKLNIWFLIITQTNSWPLIQESHVSTC